MITRVFDAPRSLVFKIWTQPPHMKHWWGPRGYTTLSCEIDLRPGGAWRVASRHTDGSETAEQGVFREIVEPERLVFTHAWEDEEGKPGHETLVTVTFVEQDGKTRLTFHQAAVHLGRNPRRSWPGLERELRHAGGASGKCLMSRVAGARRHGANGSGSPSSRCRACSIRWT